MHQCRRIGTQTEKTSIIHRRLENLFAEIVIMTYTQRFALLVTLLVFSSTSWAYLDPGTGSALVQGIIGALAALVLTAKLWWHRLLVLLGIRKRSTRTLPLEAGQEGAEREDSSR